MHSNLEGAHISGCERLAPVDRVESLAAAMVRRALQHPKGQADCLSLTIEAVSPASVQTTSLLDLTTIRAADYHQGRRMAAELLQRAGVSALAVASAVGYMAAGAAPGGTSMRGAMLVDAVDGTRLEPDPSRGVRASRMDLSESAETELRQRLALRGLDNPHVREALVLATKVMSAPGIVAELCWSDDPDYTAGYVASREYGYVRFAHLKPHGEERGGRAFFVCRQEVELEPLIAYLERSVLLITEVGEIGGPVDWEDV